VAAAQLRRHWHARISRTIPPGRPTATRSTCGSTTTCPARTRCSGG
jgi:hypothetical protein